MPSTMLQGDCLTVLRQMPGESVHCVVTSPPYWGLRDYKLPPVVWDAKEGCEHQWSEHIEPAADGTLTLEGNSAHRAGHQGTVSATLKPKVSAFCALCGAWRGVLGLEPDPDAYVRHLVEVFREVRRVLRDDGTVFLNLGDSYSGGDRVSNKPQSISNNAFDLPLAACPNRQIGDHPTIKPSDLCGIPERVVLALQADGWHWYSTIIWAKESSMPESVAGPRWERCRVKVVPSARAEPESYHATSQYHQAQGARDGREFLDHSKEWADCPGCPKCTPHNSLVYRRGRWRPTRSFEYIYLLSKGPEPYSDYLAVREKAIHEGRIVKATGPFARNANHGESWRIGEGFTQHDALVVGRNPRNVMTFKAEPCNWDFCLACGTWFGKGGHDRKTIKRWQTEEVDEDGTERSVAHRRCSNCREVDQFADHYAMFPPSVPTWCIKAGTSEKGVCDQCGEPWVRVIETKTGRIRGGSYQDNAMGHEASNRIRENGSSQTLGWLPSCDCPLSQPVPATVLDPFAGAGTTLLAADRLGRDAVGIELSESYVALSKARLLSDAPLLMKVPGVKTEESANYPSTSSYDKRDKENED